MVRLDIISDPICPWCYVGKANLDRALTENPNHPFSIEWHPYQLNPDMPLEGMDRRAYLEGKFGGKEGAVTAYAPLVKAAEAAGLTLNLEGIKTTPNTINAHRLIHWAGLEDRQIVVVSALFKAYFVEGRNIGDTDVLADIADSVGMDAAVVRRLLEGDQDIQDIQDRDKHSREMGVTGVPCFIVAGQHAVPGAQPPEVWAKVIADINAQSAQEAKD
ncbi:DsbA family oxidoreductase [Falsihalocynthiibacter arcticus]|uniref:Polyketide biosynthesis protein n=1 Tax=Falsihalocynthiibacter arcticus TaxID=1579316 RepID=A0A126V2Z7_9RHOB|nr:DsbA family oxidoreductase [Falsihalocynthiibacter arcticus]AML52692.1 polyketide biosynthesis protein [Falsihalocynthiibacter arcticus]